MVSQHIFAGNMKRSFPENSTRTPGCLPVPLFNQRKRTRQPLTSNPLKNDPSANSTADNFDFSSMLADCGWETTTLEPTQSQKQQALGYMKSVKGHYLVEDNDFNANTWKRNDSSAFGRGTGNRQSSQYENWKGSGPTQVKLAGNRQASQQSGNRAGAMEKSKSSTSAMLRGPQPQSMPYSFQRNPCQPKAHEETDNPTPDDKMIQKGPAHAARLKEKDYSLRILSAVIESMKHWSQYADKTPLLFEVLGVLDSAVTPGPYGAKTFLLRDGKESVPCAFYEIDRDLPRLIRGRVHRCMGNYDAKRKVFRCVSVRPATANEEQTFQDFVRVADLEMGKYVKTSNEV
ncbi:spermatogenesis-associated protein 22 [Sceloporus undulatus]|uniref:spermatogenesis-associated protein 22 n=1 Tax=Sceloporus undulatus TaxID=8520 RepID=UPI001C4AAEE4|nr:spermatogenesis-associated protein 22 [Sceloporus undulatus]